MKNIKKLPEFGIGSMATCTGYDLELLVGWIENLVSEEADKRLTKRGQERLEKAENALYLLQEVLEY